MRAFAYCSSMVTMIEYMSEDEHIACTLFDLLFQIVSEMCPNDNYFLCISLHPIFMKV